MFIEYLSRQQSSKMKDWSKRGTSEVTLSATDVESNDTSEDDVKVRSRDQRLALLGDPKCVVCGRYGEYICNETDDDICSLECKQIVLARVANSRTVKTFPVNDECHYVLDSDKRLKCASNGQSVLLRKRLDIIVKGNDIPAPISSFGSCDLPERLQHNLESAGFDMPTPVQMQAIPAAMARKSLLVSAETGSGKTASFLVPIICYCTDASLSISPRLRKPQAIVLEPTRELCSQVEEQAKLLGKGLPFKTALVVGGDAMAGQLYRIQQGVELIVATPGRLIDLLMKHEIEIDGVKILILDEVDCLLQKGFRDQVMQIFTALSRPQLLMYSATVSGDVEKMASMMDQRISYVSVGQSNRPNKAVKQIAIWVETKQKKKKLFDILSSKVHFTPPAIVFVGSKLGADLLANAITTTTGLKALSLHGEKSMKERREIMQSFFTGESPLLVATGVLSRGVDLLAVQQVIVFDMPNSIREYVHQIGRASRLNKEGRAIVFVNEENKNVLSHFVELLRSSGAPVPGELLSLRYQSSSSCGGKGQKKRKQLC